MKKLFFTLLLFVPLLVLSQGNNIYKQTSEFAFHTVQKDTLFLDMSNYATRGIIRVWIDDSLYRDIKPVIVILPSEEFYCTLDAIDSYIVWSYAENKSAYSGNPPIPESEPYEVSRQSNLTLPIRFNK